MKLSTKGRYAVRGMLDLAQHYQEVWYWLKMLPDGKEFQNVIWSTSLFHLKKTGWLRVCVVRMVVSH